MGRQAAGDWPARRKAWARRGRARGLARRGKPARIRDHEEGISRHVGEAKTIFASLARSSRIRWEPPGTGRASISPSFPAHATRVELCLFDSVNSTEETRLHSAARADGSGLALLFARRPTRPAVRLSRARSVRSGAGPSLQSEQGLAGSVRQAIGRGIRWSDAMFGYRSAIPRRTCRSTAATTPSTRRWRWSSTPAFRWGRDRPPRTPWHKTVIYETHVRGFTMQHPDVPDALARHLRRPGFARDDPPLCNAGRHGRRADAGPSPRRRSPPGRARTDQLLGLQHALVFRPGHSLRRTRQRRCGARIQADGAAPAPGRARSDSGRGLQPHGRRQSAGPHACRCAASTTHRTIGWCTTNGATTWTTPAAAIRSTCSVRTCCS